MRDHVLVIGAGVAGLAAAADLRTHEIDVTLLEAAERIGGRVHTSQIGAHPFDHGASWLHDAQRNPLADIARAEGYDPIDSAVSRQRQVMVGSRLATEAELADRITLWQRLDRLATSETRDLAFARVIDPLRSNRWTASVEAWEASQIAAADPQDFSVQDWRINALEGINLTLPNGLGSFIVQSLGPKAGPVFLSTPVTSLDWRGPILAETHAGTIRADACIVTASTAALAHIRFTPALPVSTHGLPMGLLTKVALRATGTDRLDLAPDCSVTGQIAPGEAMLSMFAWPGGADHVVCFIGGPPAWELSRAGTEATIDFARARLRSWFGTRADRALGDAIVTDWGTNPWHGGAYAYARPGHWQDRTRLAEPLAEGRLVIAGEATRTDGLAGTVGGAYLDGQRAAATVRAALPRRA